MPLDHLISLSMPFLMSAAFVTLNEMGDKTQLLAMAMATRYRFWKVMLGVLIATLLNHGLAVAAGALLASVPGWEGVVKLIAAFLFIIFGLWALKPDKIEDDKGCPKRSRGEVATVAIAFFIAEMGDKTQLATITLAANYSSTPLLVLLGTTTGMLIADGIGIVAGVLLHHKLPDALLKVLAATVFVVFGLIGLWESCRQTLHLSGTLTGVIVAAATLISLALGLAIYKKEKKSRAA